MLEEAHIQNSPEFPAILCRSWKTIAKMATRRLNPAVLKKLRQELLSTLPSFGWLAVFVLIPTLLVLTFAFLVGNIALQYGAARLPAHTTALVMLSEVVFASVSSVILGATVLDTRTLLGGALIMLAALLSVRAGGQSS